MTNEDAVAIVKEARITYYKLSSSYGIASPVLCISKGFLDTVQESLEKQIPKKPISKFKKRIGGKREWFCYCGNQLYEIYGNIEFGHKADYCEVCGQAIDWSRND